MKQNETRPLAEAVGLPLANPLVDGHGNLLLPVGSVISESLAERLADKGITEVVVEVDIVLSEAEEEARTAVVREKLDRLFRHAGDGAETRALYQLILDYRLEHTP